MNTLFLKYQKETKLLSLAVLFCCCVLADTSCMAAAPAQTITMSMEDFNKLEQTSMQLQTALDESATALTVARKLLTASDEELTELLDTLTQLQTELAAQKKMSALLLNNLIALQQESLTLNEQLQKAEASLNSTEKAYQKEKTRIERQKRMWQVIAAVAAGVAAWR